MRMLITGSRQWSDRRQVHVWMLQAAEKYDDGKGITVVHGHCPTGGDRIADLFAQTRGWTVERHPSPWHLFGNHAGPLRNAYMVGKGADVCLAFILRGSKGATNCARLAEWAGIPTFRFEQWDHDPPE